MNEAEPLALIGQSKWDIDFGQTEVVGGILLWLQDTFPYLTIEEEQPGMFSMNNVKHALSLDKLPRVGILNIRDGFVQFYRNHRIEMADPKMLDRLYKNISDYFSWRRSDV